LVTFEVAEEELLPARAVAAAALAAEVTRAQLAVAGRV
jgi:hypothetical protein